MFRAKKLDIGSFVNVKVIRDHTKRKVFAEHEAERYEVQFRGFTYEDTAGPNSLTTHPQTSSTICYSQSEPPSKNARPSPARIEPDALLHTVHTDP